jgi:hypothetical protein
MVLKMDKILKLKNHSESHEMTHTENSFYQKLQNDKFSQQSACNILYRFDDLPTLQDRFGGML